MEEAFMMIKWVTGVVLLSWGALSSAHDAQYYRLNPKALQQALETCPQKQPVQVDCEQLKTMASEVNDLVYQICINAKFIQISIN